MAVKILPGNYQMVRQINLLKSIKLMIALNIFSLLVFILLIYTFPFIFLRGGQEFEVTIQLPAVLIIFLGTVVAIIVHELTHGIFIKHFSKDRVQYGFHGIAASAGSPDYFFNKKEYIIVALAPFVIIDTVMIIILAFLSGPALVALYIIMAIHTAGCVGDWYVTMLLMKYDKDIYIKDTGAEMMFFVEEKR